MMRTTTLQRSLGAAMCLAASLAHAAPPGEVSRLLLVAASDPSRGDSATWDSVAGADSYRLYRGDRASLPDLLTALPESCRVGTFGVNESGPILDDEPPVADLQWFVVTAVNDDGEGDVGFGRSLEPWGGCCARTAFADPFDGVDGGSWPARWQGSFDVDDAHVMAGAARWRPTLSNYSLGRLTSVGDARDVEVTFTVQFEDIAQQGVGFYVRQNGGHLRLTSPFGQGYAVFVEGFRGTPGIGLWKEEDGVEIALNIWFDASLDLQNGIDYRVRFRVTQVDPATTRLQARMWPLAATEPSAWQVEQLDTTPVLQGVSGGFGVDSWSSITTGGPTPQYTMIDDIRIRRLCNPLEGATAAAPLQETFIFTEGPKWRDGGWLFSDIDGDTIYRYEGAGPAVVHRAPSGNANGLENDVDRELLACEHGNRRVSRESSTGVVTTVVDQYQGMLLNSPNDLDVRGDGTIYFTDPGYGLDMPSSRELPFNGLFRIAPSGALVLEWQGDEATTGPNGVALSPDQRTLYMSDSERGLVLAFDVARDGTLSGERTLATGLTIPDGLCIDMAGNIYVATWSSTIEVVAADGTRWGSLAIPRQATNCAFGGVDRQSLFVTAHEGVYELRLIQPGLP